MTPSATDILAGARARWRVLVVAGVALVVGGLAVYRSGLLTSRSDAERAEAAHASSIREGKRIYSSVALADLAPLDSLEAVKTLLRGLDARSTEADQDRDAIVDLAAEFIYYRFAQGSVDEYKRWRRSRGEELIDPARLRGRQVPEDYVRCVGREYPGDAAAEAAFDDMWAVGRNAPAGGFKVGALASEPRGLCLALGELGPAGVGAFPRLAGDLGEAAWEGTRAGSFRVWWEHPTRSLTAAIKSSPRTRVATVGLIVELDDGKRLPLRLLLYQHPEERRWRLAGIQVTNADPYWFTQPFES